MRGGGYDDLPPIRPLLVRAYKGGMKAIKGKILEEALLGVLEWFYGNRRPFKSPRAQPAVAPDGNVVSFFR